MPIVPHEKLDIGLVGAYDFSRAQIVFRAKQPGRMEKF